MKMNLRSLLLLLVGNAAVGVLSAQTETDTVSKHIEVQEVRVQVAKSNALLSEMPQKVEVISARQLSSIPGSDLGTALSFTSSIDIIKYPGILSSVGMRGFSPTTANKYNALLIDGLPAGTKNFASIDVNGIEQVEILKGPFSSMYGSSAMAGVINIVTPKSKGTFGGTARIGMGSYMTSVASVNAGGRIAESPISFDLSAGMENQGADYTVGSNNIFKLNDLEKAIIDKENTDSQKFFNTRYSKFTGSLRLGADIGENWEINLRQSYFAARDVLSHGSVWGVYNQNKKDMDRISERLEIEGRMGRHTLVAAPYFSADFSKNYNNDTDSAFIQSRSEYYTYGAQIYDRIKIGNHTLVIGADNSVTQNASKRWASPAENIAPYSPDNNLHSIAGFLQAQLSFFEEKMSVSAGARVENISYTIQETKLMEHKESTESHAIANPNIGIRYQLLPFASIRASYGTAFFSPDAIQKAGNYEYQGRKYVGNPSLAPERSSTYDIGLGLKSTKHGLGLDVSYFATQHNDMIISQSIDPDGTPRTGDEYTTYKNAQSAEMSGIETEASYNIGTLFSNKFLLRAYCNATIMLNAKMKLNDTTTADQKYIRRQNANFGLEFRSIAGLSIRANGRYIGKRLEDNWFSWYPDVRPGMAELVEIHQPENNSNGLLWHPQFMVFHLSASCPIGPRLTAGILLSNILDENYTEKDGYNMPGRSFMANLAVKF
jgi:vitamin B12 transporter